MAMRFPKHALQQYTNALVECDISFHDTDINIWTKYAKTNKISLLASLNILTVSLQNANGIMEYMG